MPEAFGLLYDGRSARPRRVAIGVRPAGLDLVDEAGAAEDWPYDETTRLEDEGRGELRLARGEARLVVGDAETAAAIAAAAPRLAPRRASQRLLRVLAIVLGTAALGAGFWFGLPLAAGFTAAVLPASWEERLGNAVLDDMPGKTCADAGGQAALDLLVAELTRGTRVPYALEIHVRDDKRVNAFAAPGGRIVVLRGLIDEAKSADELAGVLGHELTHTLKRHPTQALIRLYGTSLVLDVLMGGSSLRTGGTIAELLAAFSYARGLEEEADAGALDLLDKAGIDAQPFADFFARLEKKERFKFLPEYLSTHPPTAERRARIKPVSGATKPALDDAPWQALKKICGAT